MRGARSIAVLLAWAIGPWSSVVLASAGNLDLSFAGTGKVVDSLATYHFDAFAALRPDGRIVTAGTVGFDGAIGLDIYFALTRHLPDGALDASFGVDGLLVDFGIPHGAKLYAVVLQPDGRIIAVGVASGGALLVRYNEDGSRDSSFGLNGVVTTSYSPLQAEIHAVALQPDGAIVVAGQVIQTIVNGDNPTFFMLARYAPNGDLDQAFGTGGKVITAFGLKSSADAVALQPDGKIVAAGYSRLAGIAPSSVAVARYVTTGALDPTFGTDGRSIAHPAAPDIYVSAAAVSIQSDAKIVTAGDPGVVRFMENGVLDSAFGLQGLAISDFGPVTSIRSMVLQPNGKIVVAGFVESPTSFVLARYSTDGALDRSFGARGVTITTIGVAAAANSVALQPDGKIVAAGIGNGGNGFALARYLATDPAGATAIPTVSRNNALCLALMVIVAALVFGRSGSNKRTSRYRGY